MQTELQPEVIVQPVHLVVVPHTHWDREWYQPFQEMRVRLVRCIDRLLEILDDDPAFTHFHLDGQAIVLEDYLDIRPQYRGHLRRLIRAGRIAVGPWYVSPDEFLVSGESLIRNLQIGHRLAAEFGGVLKIGYLPDQFGHIAQMPQILAGFDIDCAVVWRGVGADVTRTAFTWQGPDGSNLFTVYLADSGYSNGRSLPEGAEALRRRLMAIIAEQAPYRTIHSLLVMNGTDHQEPQRILPTALPAAAQGIDGLTYEIAPLRVFIERSRAESKALQVHRGELRSPLRAHLLPGVTSVRVRQKQRDFENVSRLERYAEPLALWADLLAHGRAQQLTQFIDWAWKIEMRNHAHDSICGCSVDQVHRDMESRFDRVELSGKQIVQQALGALAGALDTSQVAPDRALIVYNPNGPGMNVVRAELYLDGGADLCVEDADGRELPVDVEAGESEVLFAAEVSPAEARSQIAAIQQREFLGHVINDIAVQRSGDRLTVLLMMDRVARGRFDLEAGRARGLQEVDDPTLRTVAVRAQTGVPTRLTWVAPQLTGHGFNVFALRRRPRQAVAEFVAGQRHVQNEYFDVSVNDDGSLGVTDRQSGVCLPRCNWFVDEGDRGDEYNFDPVVGDPAVMQPAVAPEVHLEAGNATVATLRISQAYAVPRQLHADRESRVAERVLVPITTTVRLYAGVKRIDFETVVDNRACDHRLRVHFQTPLPVGSAFMEQAFGVVERGFDAEPGGGVERPIGTVPQKAFACIQHAGQGVALFNRGIPEVEVRRNESGSEMVLTLIRAVGWLSRGDLRWRHGYAGPGLETPDAQSLGVQRFEYALTTFAGDWETAGVVTQAHQFAYPPLATMSDAHAGPLPADAALVRCDNPAIIVSAITAGRHTGTFIVRCYNASARPQTAVIELGAASHTRTVNFLEQVVRNRLRRLRQGKLRLQFGPWEIINLQSRFSTDKWRWLEARMGLHSQGGVELEG